jgi:hypothetical protein
MGLLLNAAQRQFLWSIRLLLVLRVAVIVGVFVVLMRMGVL